MPNDLPQCITAIPRNGEDNQVYGTGLLIDNDFLSH